MAGGIGSRFWPMSSPEMPKQFIDVLGCGRTLIFCSAIDQWKDVVKQLFFFIDSRFTSHNTDCII